MIEKSLNNAEMKRYLSFAKFGPIRKEVEADSFESAL